MISLLSTILELSYTSKIKIPKWLDFFIITALFLFIVLITYLALNSLSIAFFAIIDLSVTLCILTAKKNIK